MSCLSPVSFSPGAGCHLAGRNFHFGQHHMASLVPVRANTTLCCRLQILRQPSSVQSRVNACRFGTIQSRAHWLRVKPCLRFTLMFTNEESFQSPSSLIDCAGGCDGRFRAVYILALQTKAMQIKLSAHCCKYKLTLLSQIRSPRKELM